MLAPAWFLMVLAAFAAPPTGSGPEPSPSEKKLIDLAGEISQTLASRPEAVETSYVNSDTGLEITLTLKSGESTRVAGTGSATFRALMLLFNELSIASQRNDAAKAGKPFELSKRKPLILNIYERD